MSTKPSKAELLAAKSVGWEERVLDYDPRDGDFDQGRTLVDEVRVVHRAGGPCYTCGGQVVPGTLARTLRAAYEDGVYGGRHCEECCDAMALWSAAMRGELGDADARKAAMDALEARYRLLRERQRAGGGEG